MNRKTNPSTLSGATRWLAFGAIAGPVLFTLSWFTLGFLSTGYTLFGTRIEPYSSITQPISGLGMGSTAPFMNTAFIVMGILLIAGVLGIFQSIKQMSAATRWSCTVLLALPGLGAIICGIFNLELFMLHFLGFGLLLMSVPGFLVTGFLLRRVPRWRRFGNWLMIASPLTVVLTILYFATFNPEAAGQGLGVAGVTQRIMVTEILVWYVAMGWLALRRG